MRTSNRYNKFYGTFNNRNSSRIYEAVNRPLRFNYVNEIARNEIKNMFPNFEYNGTSTAIITQHPNASIMEDSAKMTIDYSTSVVTAITPEEVHNLGGQRFKNRRKTYLIELEKR